MQHFALEICCVQNQLKKLFLSVSESAVSQSRSYSTSKSDCYSGVADDISGVKELKEAAVSCSFAEAG